MTDSETSASTGDAFNDTRRSRKSTLLKRWTELGDGMLHNQPPAQSNWNAYLFVNRVEVRQTPAGKRYLERTVDVEALKAESREDMEDAIGEFAMRGDVRLLGPGIEPNQLPRRQPDPPDDVVSGSARIYAPREQSTEIYDVVPPRGHLDCQGHGSCQPRKK